jgi:hypothetical protein
MTNFWQALDQIQPAVDPVELEYRLYYNDLGEPLFYSTDNQPGNYIIIDKETYAVGRYDVRIVDGKLIKPTEYVYQKLVPVITGNDVSIVTPNQKWKLKRYE